MVSKLKSTFVTDEFISAVADSLATGNAIMLTTAVASSTTYTDAQLSGLNYAGSQSATKNLTSNLNSAVVKADTNTIVIDVDLVNQNLNADFKISTVLINATYKGANILVGVVRFETPELFPAYDNISIYELEMKLYISVSRIADAKINVNSAGMATAKSVQDLRTYVDGDFNADIARKTKDNIFTGTNTFNKKIIAPAGVQGNADTATKLQTARKINGTNFDGTADINVNAANDSNLVHKTGDETIAGNKTFSSPIFGRFTSKDVDVTDFNDIAKTMYSHAGIINIRGTALANGPEPGMTWYTVVVSPTIANDAGSMVAYANGKMFYTGVGSGVIQGWVKLANDRDVAHNTGNETIAGTKNFTGNAIFNNLIDGYTKTKETPNNDINLIKTPGKYRLQSTYLNVPSGMPNSSIMFVEENIEHTVIYQTILTRDVDGLTNGDIDMFIRLLIDNNWTPWRKLAQDQQVLHLSGDETASGFKNFSGNIATTSDNSMINGGGNNGDIAFVKKSGDTSFLATGNKNNLFRIRLGSNAAISPSDTFTDMFTVDKSGIVKAGTQQDLVPLDKNVVHKTGAETIAGAKAFTDRAVFDKAIYGKFESRVLPDGTDLYTLIENNVFYTVPTYSKSQTIVNKPSEVKTAFGILAADVGGYQLNSYAATSLLLFEYGSGKMFIASLQANGSGVITVSKSWTKIATDDSLLVHNTGNEDILGNKTFKQNVTTAGIEIMSGTPFVDFHFGNDSGDYTSRIAEYVKGELNINSVKLSGGTISGTLNGNASSATKLSTARNINGVAFDGTSDIIIDPVTRSIDSAVDLFTLPNGFYFNAGVASTNKPSAASNYFVVEVIQVNTNGFMRLIDSNGLSFWTTKSSSTWGVWHQDADDATVVHNSGNETIGGSKTFSSLINGNLNGNSSTASKLQTARTIGGVAFDGSANINLPGVNTAGNQNTTGNAATATKLQFARKINGVSFDGSGDISVNAANDSNLVHKDGNDNITGTLTVSGTANLTGQVNFITRTITWNSGILQGTWNIQRVGKWVSAKLDFPTIPYTSGTGKTTLSLPVGFRPSSPFTRELEQGGAGLDSAGFIFIREEYHDANAMTFYYPTNDAFPSA